jgi:hypothetical protein
MMESSLQNVGPAPAPAGPAFRTARTVIGYGVATALMLVSPLLVFAPASLFHCAIRNGRRAAWAAFAVATALAGLYFAQVANVSGPAGNMAYASFAAVMLSVALPAMAALPLVERSEKFGTVLIFVIIGSAIGLAGTEISMRFLAGFSPLAAQAAKAQEYAGSILQVYRNANAGSEVIRGIQQWMKYALAVLPAFILVDICLVFILSLMMIGRLKTWRAYASDRVVIPQGDRIYLFRHLSVPEWLLFAFVFGGLTPLTSGLLQRIAANVLVVVLFLYLLQGLAIFRFMLVRAGAGVLGNVFGFLLLAVMVLTGFGLLLLIIAGLFDSFFDFRHLKRKDDSHESHTD